MTLIAGLNTGLTGLSTISDQIAVVSRNVANAGDPSASRKTANVVSVPGSGVRIDSVTRAVNTALFDKLLGATSDSSAQKAIVDAVNQLDTTVNDPQLEASPAALLSKLQSAIQTYSAAPQNATAGQATIMAAKDLAQSLNSATLTVQQVRGQADADMAASVSNLSSLLGQFEAVNNEIVKGTVKGADVTDYLDQRDKLLASISEEVGIRTVSRTNNDMAIYTDSGATLFDKKARSVTFTPTPLYSATTIGNEVSIDGIPITGNAGSMLARSGKLVGLATVRDTTAVSYQNQLDEIARGLILTFAEKDQSATPTLPDRTGLFTYPGAPATPAAGAISAGIAGTIQVSAAVDPDKGGNPSLLRDGGVSGSAYIYNSTGASAYTDRLQQIIDSLDATQSFDPSAKNGASATLANYASSSVAWLEAIRKSATSDADYKETLRQTSSNALSSETGVNMDQEMTRMLELERSYQASSRIITTIDGMFNALLQAAGAPTTR
jgi:flagellar hook-associated protein 1 FlgK